MENERLGGMRTILYSYFGVFDFYCLKWSLRDFWLGVKVKQRKWTDRMAHRGANPIFKLKLIDELILLCDSFKILRWFNRNLIKYKNLLIIMRSRNKIK